MTLPSHSRTNLPAILQDFFDELEPEEYADVVELLCQRITDSDWYKATCGEVIREAGETFCCRACTGMLDAHADRIRSGKVSNPLSL